MGVAERATSSIRFRLSKNALGDIPRRADFPALQTPIRLTKKRGKSLGGRFGPCRKIASSLECGLGLVRRRPLRKGDCQSVGSLEIDAALALGGDGLDLVRFRECRQAPLR